MSTPDADQQQKTEKEIRRAVEEYAAEHGYAINPDTKTADTIFRGLAKRQMKSGQPYCPCRIMSGDADKDKGIICPCEFHKDEIAKDGICHCRLLVSRDYPRQ